jgi:hypothetical protein
MGFGSGQNGRDWLAHLAAIDANVWHGCVELRATQCVPLAGECVDKKIRLQCQHIKEGGLSLLSLHIHVHVKNKINYWSDRVLQEDGGSVQVEGKYGSVWEVAVLVCIYNIYNGIYSNHRVFMPSSKPLVSFIPPYSLLVVLWSTILWPCDIYLLCIVRHSRLSYMIIY